ncbi:MAG TPA: alpha/beta hydrolase [Dehalococcoidia bacterium]|nr:alpha/beta hydrolase [Dehalococcoidia bacterium]
MDTLPIRYTSTEDNFSIAYLDAGDGYPVLHIPYPMNHLQLQWKHQVFRESLESLATRYRLIAFDGRGQGLSDR